MSVEHLWLPKMVCGCDSPIHDRQLRHKMRTNRYRMNLAMTFQSVRINWELILQLYYSTRNGFIKRELCVPSGSLMYNHYYSCTYISKMANFLRFKTHKTTISTEFDNLIAIQIQFMIDVRIIGILIDLIK